MSARIIITVIIYLISKHLLIKIFFRPLAVVRGYELWLIRQDVVTAGKQNTCMCGKVLTTTIPGGHPSGN